MIGSSAIFCFALVHVSLTGVDAVQLRSHVNPIARITETTSKIDELREKYLELLLLILPISEFIQ